MFATVNVDGETTCPVELIVQAGAGDAAIILLGLLSIDLHGPTSPVLKPLPETVTEVPTGPELGVSVIDGVGTVTVNVADA